MRVVTLLALGLTGCVGLFSSAGPRRPRWPEVRLENQSGAWLCFANLRDSAGNPAAERENWLEASLAPGGSVHFQLEPGRYDLSATTCAARSIRQPGLAVAHDLTVVIR